MNSTQKSFIGPKHGTFQELKQEISEGVHLKRKTGTDHIQNNKIYSTGTCQITPTPVSFVQGHHSLMHTYDTGQQVL